MNEDQKKWLLYLQEKGFRFNEYHDDLAMWLENSELLDFTRDLDCYRISAQPIPDIPGWRELCREMQGKGVVFEFDQGTPGFLKMNSNSFAWNIKDYRIPQQPLPEWREETIEVSTGIASREYKEAQQHKNEQSRAILESTNNMTLTKETKPGPREEIPHRELQIQWHKDKLHSLETGEEMREWEVKYWDRNEFGLVEEPLWDVKCEYRRKPKVKKVTYWHCLCKSEYGTIVTGSYESKEHLIQCLTDDGHIILSPITETTVEMETPE